MALQNKIIYGILIAIVIATSFYFVFSAVENVSITAYVPGEVRENVLGWSYNGSSGQSNSDSVTDVSTNTSVPSSFRPASLVSFSILVYWFRRENPPPQIDLNGDGKITIVDFSIFAFNHGIVL